MLNVEKRERERNSIIIKIDYIIIHAFINIIQQLNPWTIHGQLNTATSTANAFVIKKNEYIYEATVLFIHIIKTCMSNPLDSSKTNNRSIINYESRYKLWFAVLDWCVRRCFVMCHAWMLFVQFSTSKYTGS